VDGLTDALNRLDLFVSEEQDRLDKKVAELWASVRAVTNKFSTT